MKVKALICSMVMVCILAYLNGCQNKVQEISSGEKVPDETQVVGTEKVTMEEVVENATETAIESQEVKEKEENVRILSDNKEVNLDEIYKNYIAFVNKELQSGKANVLVKEISNFCWIQNKNVSELVNEHNEKAMLEINMTMGLKSKSNLMSLYFYLPDSKDLRQIKFASANSEVSFYSTQFAAVLPVADHKDQDQYELYLWKSTNDESMNEQYYNLKELLDSSEDITITFIGARELNVPLTKDDIDNLLYSYYLFDELLAYYS